MGVLLWVSFLFIFEEFYGFRASGVLAHTHSGARLGSDLSPSFSTQFLGRQQAAIQICKAEGFLFFNFKTAHMGSPVGPTKHEQLPSSQVPGPRWLQPPTLFLASMPLGCPVNTLLVSSAHFWKLNFLFLAFKPSHELREKNILSRIFTYL